MAMEKPYDFRASQTRFAMKKIKATLLVLGVLALVGTSRLAVWLWSVEDPYPARLEVLKTMLELVAVVGFGSLATFLVEATIKERDRAANALEFRKLASRRMVRSYMAVKKIRRQLRAGRDVRELFDRLNAVQLALESMKKEVDFAPSFAHGNAIVSGLRSMEKYVGTIVKECERKIPNEEAFFPFSSPAVTRLADFTGPYAGSCFQARFVHAFDVVLTLMRREIVGRPDGSSLPIVDQQEEDESDGKVAGERSCPDGWFTLPPAHRNSDSENRTRR
jgi:hypothetical protein